MKRCASAFGGESPTAGKNYSGKCGKFVLRIGEDLHEKLSLKALTEGDSLNNFCKKSLEKAFT